MTLIGKTLAFAVQAQPAIEELARIIGRNSHVLAGAVSGLYVYFFARTCVVLNR